MSVRTRPLFAVFVALVLSLSACGPAAAPQASPPTATIAVPEATQTVAPPTVSDVTPIVPTVNAAPTATVSPATVEPAKLTRFNFTSKALEGNLLGDPATRNVWILLPPGYAASTKRYPVVYVLHGWGNGVSDHMLTPVKSAVQRAIKKGQLQDMILVFPDAGNSLYGGQYLDSPTTGGYDTYITRDLVNYVDSHYRTLAQRESRGVMGCSMGGDGAAHLGLAHPDVFSVVVPVAGVYDFGPEGWKEGGAGFKEPKNMKDFEALPWLMQWALSRAAASAPNPNKPPFYLDMPWVNTGGEVDIVGSTLEKIQAQDAFHDARKYAQQPQKLNAFMLLHARGDPMNEVQLSRAFDKLLTSLGIDHTLAETDENSHCDIDYTPAVKFMSEHLASE